MLKQGRLDLYNILHSQWGHIAASYSEIRTGATGDVVTEVEGDHDQIEDRRRLRSIGEVFQALGWSHALISDTVCIAKGSQFGHQTSKFGVFT